jgi:NAD(P)-dependent dehydrogenase (short-subunit alcohol dehydrogenase family)
VGGPRRPIGSDRFAEITLAPLPIKRLGEPTDVAAMAAYLASDESSYVNPANFVIDGGLTAT